MDTRIWHGPFSSRLPSKWFDIGLFTEVKEGRGTPHGGIWADFRGLVPEPAGRSTHERVAGRYRRRVANAWDGPVELSLFVFAFNGGIRINEHGQTSVPGLLACGEAAGGMHSADRLGGMAFASTQVFGARAGAAAALYAGPHAGANRTGTVARDVLDRLATRLSGGGDANPGEVRRRIQDIMWRNAMICKDEKGLTACLDTLTAITETELPRCAPGRHESVFRTLELDNLVAVARIITAVARERKESRGPHYRTDFPEPDDAFAGSYLVKQQDAPGERVDYSLRLVDLTEE